MFMCWRNRRYDYYDNDVRGTRDRRRTFVCECREVRGTRDRNDWNDYQWFRGGRGSCGCGNRGGSRGSRCGCR